MCISYSYVAYIRIYIYMYVYILYKHSDDVMLFKAVNKYRIVVQAYDKVKINTLVFMEK